MNTPWLDATEAANGLSVKDNFAAWFGRSQIVRADKTPVPLFHGAQAQFDSFSSGSSVKGSMGQSLGHCLTDSRAAAAHYSAESQDVLQLFLRMENPLRIDARMVDSDELGTRLGVNLSAVYGCPGRAEVYWFFKNGPAYDGREKACVGDFVMQAARERGHDGVIYRERINGESVNVYLAFDAGQIKSATHNAGLYLKDGDSLTDQRAAMDLIHARQALSSVDALQARGLLKAALA